LSEEYHEVSKKYLNGKPDTEVLTIIFPLKQFANKTVNLVLEYRILGFKASMCQIKGYWKPFTKYKNCYHM
jgi:hypothetical protein